MSQGSKILMLAVPFLMALGSCNMKGTSDTEPGVTKTSNPTAADEKNQLRIAMAQIFCLDGDRSGNFVRIENAIIEAVAQQASIVCFPETCLLGWTNVDAHERAHPIPGGDSDRLCELARKHSVFLCIGLAEKDGDSLYDSAILIDDQGSILLKHRKVNILTELMDPPYSKGSQIQTVETRFGIIGMLICADTFDESSLAKMELLKPDLVLVPYGWANKESAWPQHGKSLEATVANAARRFNCPVVGTDVVGSISKGPWAGMIYGGQSVAASPTGGLIAKAADRDREIMVFDIVKAVEK